MNGAVDIVKLFDSQFPNDAIPYTLAYLSYGASDIYVYDPAGASETGTEKFLIGEKPKNNVQHLTLCALSTRKLTVTKDVQPDSSTELFGFTVECGTVQSGALQVKLSANFQLGDGGSRVVFVDRGFTCTVVEAPDVNYTALPADTQTVRLTEDQTVAFTNTLKVVAPDITVTKSPDAGSIAEPRGDVTFTVVVTNSATSPATLTALSDSDYGSLDKDGGHGWATSTCDLGGTLAANGGTYRCTFTAAVTGQPIVGSTAEHENTVTATATNTAGTDSATATVDITNVSSAISVEKTANPTSLLEPGGPVVYTVDVLKRSDVDKVTLTAASFVDDTFGPLTDIDCNGAAPGNGLETPLDIDESRSCTFTRNVTGNADLVHKNTVTVTGTDDDGAVISDDDDATVTLTDDRSSIKVTKTPSVSTLDEPGGTVTSSVVVENTSKVDTVTIASLSDDRFPAAVIECIGTRLPADLAPGAKLDCSFRGEVKGNAGSEHTNTVTATGIWSPSGRPPRR